MQTPDTGPYEKRVSHYDNEYGKDLLDKLAAQRGGLSATALLRVLTREEAARKGLSGDAQEGGE